VPARTGFVKSRPHSPSPAVLPPSCGRARDAPGHRAGWSRSGSAGNAGPALRRDTRRFGSEIANLPGRRGRRIPRSGSPHM
jgi:hypothetical protein